ncbi:hypothetical protein D3C71_1502940 [compost metagenome]
MRRSVTDPWLVCMKTDFVLPNDGLGHAGLRLIDDFEFLTGEQHPLVKLSPGPGALLLEVPSMAFKPVGERPIAFTFNGGKLCGDFVVGNDIDGLRLDDAERLA